MRTKLTKGKTLGLIGLCENKIIPIRNAICWRKPADLSTTKAVMSKYKYAIGMMSAHNIHRKPNTPFCNIWCHCLRDVKGRFLQAPKILLSESYFVDPAGIRILDRKSTWDFCYFTIGGILGNHYKGMNLFVDSLPTLCGKMNLRGLLVKYANPKANFVLNQRRRRIFDKYRKNLSIFKGKRNTAHIMAKSKFSFFPNIKDCSPLLLTSVTDASN